MKRNILLVALAIMLNVVAFAQVRVSGTVYDEDGGTLPGVTVTAKGTTSGTITDIDGKYSLAVPDGVNTLVFSFVGLKTMEVSLEKAGNVTMMSDNLGLDEVVVTALGVSREKKALGYSVQEVGGDDLDKARDANFVNSLQGKVAGVQITGSSNLGGSSRIVIRGNSSITGNNQPLFVVDGVPLDNSNFTTTDQARGAGGYDYGNMAQDINPDDIESMTVLKGASAAALYGSRGANGVILITTKKGAKGKKKGLGVTVNSSVQFNKVAWLPTYQNQYGGGAGNVFPFDSTLGQSFVDYGYDGSWGPKFEGQQVRHWDSWDERLEGFGQTRAWESSENNIQNFFETGVMATNNVAISGGTDGTTFRLSYTNLSQKGTQPNSNLGRNTISYNGRTQIGERLAASIGVNYVNTETKGLPQTGYGSSVMSMFNQWFQRQLDMDRLLEAYETTGENATWNRSAYNNAAPKYWNNPYFERYECVQSSNRDRIFGNVRLDYNLSKKISVMARAMTDVYTDRREQREAVGSVNESYYSEDVRTVGEQNYEVRLTANALKLSDNISLTAFVGANRSDRSYDRNYGITLGGLTSPGTYNLSNGVTGVQITDFTSKRRINSVFGSASFGFRNFAYLDASLRNDWSSTLPEGNNSYFYPAVSGSLVFSELMDVEWLSLGKLRVGYSQVGNDTDPYRLTNTYLNNINTGNAAFSVNNSVNNPTLRPELTTEIEIGAELAFFENRIGTEVSVYEKTTVDQIFPVSQSGATGATSAILNAGTVQNKGIEAVVNLVPVRTKDFEWTLGVNFGKNVSQVIELYEDANGNKVENIQLTSLFGVALEARVGQPYQTFVGTDFVRDANGNKLVDADGSYIATEDVVALGTVLPDFTGGFRTGFTYKNFNFNTTIDFQKGGKIFSLTNQWGKYSGTLDITTENGIRENGIVVEGMKAAYDDATGDFQRDAEGNIVGTEVANDVNIDAQTHFFNNQGYIINAADIYDASFVKWRELSMGYSIPSSLLEKTPFAGATISLVGRNLAILFRNVPNIDPEAAVSSGNVQGFEGGQLPTERSIGFNINLRF